MPQCGQRYMGRDYESPMIAGQPKDWWKQLKVIYVPARDYADGGFGFMITEQSGGQSGQGGQPRRGIIAFESRGDAQEVQWLWESFPENAPGSNKCACSFL